MNITRALEIASLPRMEARRVPMRARQIAATLTRAHEYSRHPNGLSDARRAYFRADLIDTMKYYQIALDNAGFAESLRVLDTLA